MKESETPPVNITFLRNIIPDRTWEQTPIWVMNSMGKLQPARSASMREDTQGNRIIILNTEPVP